MNKKIYQQNIESLLTYYPALAKKIQQTPIGHTVKLMVKKNHPFNLYLLKEKKAYYDVKNPIKDVEKQIDALGLRNTRIALFLGFGLGYEFVYFFNNLIKEQKTLYICIVERNPEIFKASLMTRDMRAVIGSDKIRLFVGEDIKRLFPKFVSFFSEKQKFKYLNAINPVYLNSAIKLDGGYYLKVSKIFKKAAKNKISDFGNSPLDSLIGIENMLSNLDEIINNPGINLLKNKFKGKPGIVASTGPSLDKNVHLLKTVGEKALIVSPEASLAPLLKEGVKPHIITSLERTIPVVDLVRDFDPEVVNDIYLAACPVVDREVFQQYNGPKIIVYRDFDHFRWLNLDKGILDIKVTAGNMAFKVCEYLGCDPIILIGQDLAHTRTGKTHAEGTRAVAKNGKKKQKLLTVQGNLEKEVITTPVWLQAIYAYQRDVAAYDGLCINSTEGGAYIEGTKVLPFKESIERWIDNCTSFFPSKQIKADIERFPIKKEVKREKILNLISKTKDDIDYIFKQNIQGLKKMENYRSVLQEALENEEKLSEQGVQEIKNEIYEPKKNIMDNKSYTLQYFLAHVIQSFEIHHTIKKMGIPNKYDSWQKADIAQIMFEEKYYSNMIDLIKSTKASLLETEHLLKSGEWKRTKNNLHFHRLSMPKEKFMKYFKDFI